MVPGSRPGAVQPVRWHVMDDVAELARAVAMRILRRAQDSIADHGVFRLVLAGGRTPQAVYRHISDAATDWSRWEIYFGDERCLPAADPGRNSVMALHNWLGRVAIPSGNIHPIRVELGPAAAAREYSALVARALPFDMVLLGMGEDGHTASLFPGHRHDEAELVHAVLDAPKAPAERVSLGLAALNAAQEVLVLITGSDKSGAVQRWQAGEDLPVTRIHGHNGADVYIDVAANKTPPAKNKQDQARESG
ncbi:MAG: 6-phosphogluconolactonase [Gammaproteobacteria bacterium]